uniref:C2H2-type domain-containing protein n=1 Tax=Globodera rostochiensis TaxID=31243 RepID=A0A914I6E1_GLORO
MCTILLGFDLLDQNHPIRSINIHMDEPQPVQQQTEAAHSTEKKTESNLEDTREKSTQQQQRRSSACGPSVRHQRTYYQSKKQFSEAQLPIQQQSQNARSGTTAGTARERRSEFGRVQSTQNQLSQWNNSKNCFNAEKTVRVDKNRSMSTTFATETIVAGEGTRKSFKKHRNRNSTTELRTTSTNSMSNGESVDYDEMELDEPFSESEGEESPRVRGIKKPCLVIPRGRIRSLSGTIPPVGFAPHWGGPTMCLSCFQFFQLPEMTREFSAHLLTEHQILIDGMDIIVDLKRYIEHWLFPETGDEAFGKMDFYFLMNERVKEDYALRQRLAMRRLEEALACQQRERDDAIFSIQCIFCRYMARGNRAKIIHHLYTIHHLNLGSPDNLVFVTEYIEHLREILLRNECIYCEKTYADRNILMEHMRKKNHREVNPKNNYYDKFYIINYLELGKRWLDVLAEDFEDTMPTFVDSDEEEEEDSWHEWQEDNADEEDLYAACLFCSHTGEKFEEIIKHMNQFHKFDLIGHIHDHGMDTYERMKFVNFLRKRTFNTQTKDQTTDPKCAEIPDKEQWDKEDHLVPMFGNDHLLWMLESWHLEQEMEEKGKQKTEDGVLIEMSVAENTDCAPKVNMGALVEESKHNTVEGVIAEDLPDLTDSVLADVDLQQSLR